MERPSCTRRTLLRRGATTATTSALVGSAGCSDVESVVGGSPDVPFPATWLPAPDRVLAADTDPARRWYPFRARRLDALAAFHDDRSTSFDSEGCIGTARRTRSSTSRPAECTRRAGRAAEGCRYWRPNSSSRRSPRTRGRGSHARAPTRRFPATAGS
ncbi:hypothetical protein [Halosegnis marinus]|uniref:hypothetical protein n=1 Tax=Halosegnis marinus TaxID=3034023 RepID=UPI00360B6DEC